MDSSVKKSVRLSASTVEVIKDTNHGDSINWSGTLNTITSRYAIFVKQLLPDLTDNEKLIIIACFGGREINNFDIEHEIEMLPLQIQYGMDKAEVVKLLPECHKDNDKLKSIKEHFCATARSWSTAQRLALLHYIGAASHC